MMKTQRRALGFLRPSDDFVLNLMAYSLRYYLNFHSLDLNQHTYSNYTHEHVVSVLWTSHERRLGVPRNTA